MLTSVLFCAVAPPQEGVEVRGGVGTSDYGYRTVGGCGSSTFYNVYEASDVRAQAQVSYRSEDGIGVTADVNIAHTSVNKLGSTEPGSPYRKNRDSTLDASTQAKGTFLSTYAVIRPSFHWTHAGAELGGGVMPESVLFPYEISESKEDAEFTDHLLFFNARAWAGVPRYAYVWADLLTGQDLPDQPLTVGVGVARDTFRLNAGVGLLGVVSGEGQVKVSDHLWLGAKLHSSLTQDRLSQYGAALTFVWTPDIGR